MVALSTSEAEYIAQTSAVKESFWLKGIAADFGVEQEVIAIGCDNNSSLSLVKQQVFHERSKYIDVRLHFVRDEVIIQLNSAQEAPVVVVYITKKRLAPGRQISYMIVDSFFVFKLHPGRQISYMIADSLFLFKLRKRG